MLKYFAWLFSSWMPWSIFSTYPPFKLNAFDQPAPGFHNKTIKPWHVVIVIKWHKFRCHNYFKSSFKSRDEDCTGLDQISSPSSCSSPTSPWRSRGLELTSRTWNLVQSELEDLKWHLIRMCSVLKFWSSPRTGYFLYLRIIQSL